MNTDLLIAGLSSLGAWLAVGLAAEAIKFFCLKLEQAVIAIGSVVTTALILKIIFSLGLV